MIGAAWWTLLGFGFLKAPSNPGTQAPATPGDAAVAGVNSEDRPTHTSASPSREVAAKEGERTLWSVPTLRGMGSALGWLFGASIVVAVLFAMPRWWREGIDWKWLLWVLAIGAIFEPGSNLAKHGYRWDNTTRVSIRTVPCPNCGRTLRAQEPTVRRGTTAEELRCPGCGHQWQHWWVGP